MGNHELFGFLTTEANAVVAPIHPKAMPVILTTSDEADRWLEAETADALALQRSLPDDALRIVAKGEKDRGADPAHGAGQKATRRIAHHERRQAPAAIGAYDAETLDVVKAWVVGAVLAEGEADAWQENLVDESFEYGGEPHVPDRDDVGLS